MIKDTRVTQPPRIRTTVVAKGQSVTVPTPSSAISVTLVTVGLTGAPGDTLPGSGDSNYVHDQTVASDLWSIQHDLGKYPSVTIVDSAGDECEGSINYVSLNLLTVSFSSAFSGRAFVN